MWGSYFLFPRVKFQQLGSFGRPFGLKRKVNFEFASVST